MGPATFERLAELHEQLAATYRELAQQAGPRESESDSVIGLPEAAARLGMTRTWLSRRANWSRVGGYRDADRRVKFAESALRAYLREAKAS
jgi:hypothetical protein